MLISGKSLTYGLLGDPVSHSLSPLMHNHAFRDNRIDAVYLPFHVLPGQLEKAVAGVRALNIAGVNVTVPHKEAIIPFLNDIDSAAQVIGAVNTVVNTDGTLTGYNTDSSGFLRALRHDLNFHPLRRNALLLGAGGACRAAAVALAGAGIASVTIANRTPVKAENIVSDIAPSFPKTVFSACSYNEERYVEAVSAADLVVNTTSVGLQGEKINFFPLEYIKSSALIYDMIYSPSETPFLENIHKMGLVGCDGLGMLAAQGEDAFFLWTGIQLPPGYMKEILLRQR